MVGAAKAQKNFETLSQVDRLLPEVVPVPFFLDSRAMGTAILSLSPKFLTFCLTNTSPRSQNHELACWVGVAGAGSSV